MTPPSRRRLPGPVRFVLFVAVVLGGGGGVIRWHTSLHGAAWSGRYLDADFRAPDAWGPPRHTLAHTVRVPLAEGSGSLRVRFTVGAYARGARAVLALRVEPGDDMPANVTASVTLADWSLATGDDPRLGHATLEATERASDGVRTHRIEVRADGRVVAAP